MSLSALCLLVVLTIVHHLASRIFLLTTVAATTTDRWTSAATRTGCWPPTRWRRWCRSTTSTTSSPSAPGAAWQPAGRGAAAGARVAARPGAVAAAGVLLPARAALHLVRVGVVGLHGAAVPVGRGASRAGGAAPDVQDVAVVGRWPVRLQHAAAEPRRRVRPAGRLLPQRRPERYVLPRPRPQPSHHDGVHQARCEAGGQGM